MVPQERKRIRQELLVALYEARKRVTALEAALAHHESLLGEGVEREGMAGKDAPGFADSPESLLQHYIGMIEPEEDISNFIGREGHDESRPRLGPDAPPEVRPDKPAPLSPLVSRLVLGHPDDTLPLTLDGNEPPALVPAAFSSKQEDEDAGAGPAYEALFSAKLREVVTDDASQEPLRTDGSAAAAPSADWPFRSAVGARSPCGTRDDDCLRSCLVLQVFNEGVWDWDMRSGELYTSRRWQEIMGGDTRQKEESPFESFVRRIHPSDVAELRARFAALRAGGVNLLDMDLRFKRGESAWGWGVLRAVGIRSNGEVSRIIAVLRDISLQRETEIALRASDEKFRALAEDLPDVISRFDGQGRFLYVSPSFSRYSSISPEQTVGKRLCELDITGEVSLFEDNVYRVFEVGIPFQEEIQFFSPLVGEFVAECRFWPEFGAEGSVMSVSTVLRDITFPRRMLENYHALFNTMDDGFILFEHVTGWMGVAPAYSADEFALVVMNPSFGRLFSLEASKAIGQRLDALMGEDAEAWADCLRQVLTAGRPAMHFLRGGAFARQFEISAYSPEEGRVACIVKDVTELRRIEQEIRLNESRFAALYSLSRMDAASEDEVARFSLDQAVKLTGSELGYLYVGGGHDGNGDRIYWSNEVLARFKHGPSLPDLCDLPWSRKGAECIDPHAAVMVNTVAQRCSEAFGRELPVRRYMLAPVLEEGRVVCIAGVANKDEDYESADLRQLELFINGIWFHLRRRWSVQDLQRAKEAAEAASRAKNEFLANVSHELRTPLNGILGMLQVLQQSPLSASQMEWVVTANYSGRSLLRIISDILDFSRIEAGSFELAPQLFDFSATVRSALGIFIHESEQKKLRFTLEMDKAIPSVLLGDDARVRQIIINLVGNAFKFTEQGEIRVECALLPRRKNGKRCIYLAVQDTGIGIPEDKLGDIFRAFTQIDGSSTRRYAGTGLGLAIVCKLVGLMGGGLGVESILGEGTVVHCSLPFDEPRQPFDSPLISAVKPEVVKPLDILVVEDDPVNQFALRTMLQQAGHTSICVGDGLQALEALTLRPFACVITDIQMPVMDGVELVGRIRSGNTAGIEPGPKVRALLGLADDAGGARVAIAEDIPIVALTAHAMAGDRDRFLGMGMDYYLAKPVFAAELAAVLGHIGMLLRAREEK